MPNFDYDLMESTEAELASYGISGEDLGTIDWRSGEIANHDDQNNSTFSDTAGGIAHELVKSFGFRRNSESGDWDWSIGNIGESFKEDPIWTTLDYLLLAVPIAKVGVAATKVAKGTGVAAKTLKKATTFEPTSIRSMGLAGDMIEAEEAARFLGGVQAGRRAKVAEKVTKWVSDPPEGFAEAVELELRHGVARNTASQWFASNVARRGVLETYDPVTRTFTQHADKEWETLLRLGGGGDPFEQRALYDTFAREQMSERTMYERMGEELIRLENKVLPTEEAKAAFGEALRRGDTPEDILRAFGKDEGMLAGKLADFRLRIHEKAHDLGILDDETYEWGIENYWPRVWQEMEEANRMQAAARGRALGGATGGTGRSAGARFQHPRTLSEDDVALMRAQQDGMTLAIDPSAGISKLIEAGSFVAAQSFLQRLGGSILVTDGLSLVDNVVDLVKGTPVDELDAVLRRRFYRTYPKNVVDDVVNTVERIRFNGQQLTNADVDDIVTKRLGWRRMDDAFKNAGLKGYMTRIPEALQGKYIDPAVARDLAGMGAFVEALPQTLRQFYMTAMTHFKATKVPYNPATHVRNGFGMLVFHHLTVGGFGPWKKGLGRGWDALEAGARIDATPEQLRDFQHIMEAGFANSSFDREIMETIRNGLKTQVGTDTKRVTALDWLKLMPGLKDTKALDKTLDAAGWAERKYRFIDELGKADAFLIRRDYWAKVLKKDEVWKGKDEATQMLEARARASQDVVKFQPVFHQNSPFTDLVRNVIPFSSFTTEAVRVWKNAMVEKPHLAYFYNHMAEGMSQMLGAVAGFDTVDLETAKSALPEYAQHKKMVVLPFRVDGKPTFLDLSYMLPMGNISESAEHEANFFDRVHMDPFSANPFLSFAYALKTGKDPFSGRPIEPRMMEQQLGLDVPTKGMGRMALGMAEHTMKMALPPLIPPGYAGMNLYELARGQKHPTSGADLEEGVLRTVAANAFGLRTYEADVSAQLLNVKREERRLNKEVGVQWDRWKFGHANGKAAMMDTAINEIKALRGRLGDEPEAVDKYILSGMKNREAGKWRGVSSKRMQETLRRSQGVTSKSREDLLMMSELHARLTERAIRTREGKERLAK